MHLSFQKRKPGTSCAHCVFCHLRKFPERALCTKFFFLIESGTSLALWRIGRGEGKWCVWWRGEAGGEGEGRERGVGVGGEEGGRESGRGRGGGGGGGAVWAGGMSVCGCLWSVSWSVECVFCAVSLSGTLWSAMSVPVDKTAFRRPLEPLASGFKQCPFSQTSSCCLSTSCNTRAKSASRNHAQRHTFVVDSGRLNAVATCLAPTPWAALLSIAKSSSEARSISHANCL